MTQSDEKQRAISTTKREFIKRVILHANTLEAMLSEASAIATFYAYNYGEGANESLVEADFQVFRFDLTEFADQMTMLQSILTQSKTTLIGDKDYQQINTRIQ